MPTTLSRSVAVLALLLAACQGGAPDDPACAGPLGAPKSSAEVSAMPSCCAAEGGAAHCLASGVPAEIAPLLAACDSGGYCVPDSLLATGASQPPATCEAFGGQGVCLSKCIPQVAENAGLLRQETCAGSDELCVPCVSPLDNMPTGACDLLELATCVGDGGGGGSGGGSATACDDPSTCNYEASCPAVIDVATLMSCAPDAHCIDAALVTDPALQARLAKCAGGTALCVPDVFLVTGGKFTPKTCNSVAGAEGRCISRVIPEIKAQEELLPQDACTTNERCAPCFDPISGADTGVCKLSCDTGPTKAPVKLAACCSMKAHCVPATSIPDEQEEFLAGDSCTTGNLCVPDQLLLGQPTPACNANGFIIGPYTGVCLSDCLDFGFNGDFLARGNCATGNTCTPCEMFGEPTGAPGCP